MIVLVEFLFSNRLYELNSKGLIFLLLIDVFILSALVYFSSDLGVYLAPFYLLLIISYASKIVKWSFLIMTIALSGFIVVVEYSDFWQSQQLLKNLVFYTLFISAIFYFVYIRKKKGFLLDPLTSLPNRALFHERMGRMTKESSGGSKKLALLFMDLDGFKQVNDTLGHNIGDHLLIDVAKRIKKVVKKTDMIARLGGDEFAIIVNDVDGLDAPVRVAEKILQTFEEPFQVNDRLIDVGISIGIAMWPDHASDINDLIRFSDVAMYSAKKEKCGYVIYSEEHNKAEIESLKIMADLRAAIRADRLDLVYQPKLDLHTGKVDSVEALIRWEHSVLGHIPPVKFITLAEGSVLINELTEWVINTALKDCSEWEKSGRILNVSVNISARNLLNEKIMVQVLSAIEKHRLQPNRVTLEITETSLMTRSDMTIKNLVGLSMMGVNLSIDDFGTGHASLVYVQKLPVREVKIDRVFVNNILNNQRDNKIVKSIIHLAHDIDCRVVAEGVESNEVLMELKKMGCDLIQGFYISKPMSSDLLVNWLNNYESRRISA